MKKLSVLEKFSPLAKITQLVVVGIASTRSDSEASTKFYLFFIRHFKIRHSRSPPLTFFYIIIMF